MTPSDPSRAAIDLLLAGLPFHVAYDVSERRWVEERFGRYSGPPAEGAFRLSIEVVAGVEPVQPPDRAYPGWCASRDAAGRLVLRRWLQRVVIDESRRTAIASVSRGPHQKQHFAMQPTSLDGALRALLSLELDRTGGLLLHASGFADGQGAHLFAAPGGGGKTTTARKLPPENVLSDDQVAVTRAPNGWVAHALPFVGEYGRPTTPRSAPLCSISLLEKADAMRVSRLAPASALARLLGCVVQHTPEAATGSALDRTLDLVSQLPVHRLALALDTPWQEIRAALESA